ncbi:MAG: hypothetical protein HQL10_06880 [Nitrospirae bacterium]|nr:hypothetical protein [Nitrospirota bacterium]
MNALKPSVSERLTPFLSEIIKNYGHGIHSVHVVGSSVTPDFDDNSSDINSLVILKNMDLSFARFLAPLGAKYGKKKIAAPLMLTPDYIMQSLDVFPVEFLDLKQIHVTVYGEDILSGITIERSYLRLQCEQEMKRRLIALRQDYISSLGSDERITTLLSRSITGIMPVLRALIFLKGQEPPVKRIEVLNTLQALSGIEKGIFEKVLTIKSGQIKPKKDEAHAIFEHYYKAAEALGTIVDDIPNAAAPQTQ